MKCAGWVVEDTEKEVLKVAGLLKEEGKIDFYDKPEQYLKGTSRKTKQLIYGYKSHCYINK